MTKTDSIPSSYAARSAKAQAVRLGQDTTLADMDLAAARLLSLIRRSGPLRPIHAEALSEALLGLAGVRLVPEAAHGRHVKEGYSDEACARCAWPAL